MISEIIDHDRRLTFDLAVTEGQQIKENSKAAINPG
jgi:hypothetical protein